MLHRIVRPLFFPRTASVLLTCLVGGSFCSRADEGRKTVEANRLSVLRVLIERRAELARAGDSSALRRCDAEIRSHPAPASGYTTALARRLVGAWRSPRHDHLYRADGSWTLLPAERGDLHGRWHIAGNRLERTAGYGGPQTRAEYTIIMIGKKDLVFTDRETVFFEKRLPPRKRLIPSKG